MPVLCAAGRSGDVAAQMKHCAGIELKKNVNHRLTVDSLARATKSASYSQRGDKPTNAIGILWCNIVALNGSSASDAARREGGLSQDRAYAYHLKPCHSSF
jgi:hypothetical protein